MDEATQLQEKLRALNEALVLGSVRQHELTAAAESLNGQLRAEIAERQQAAAALRLSEERLRLAMDAAQMGSWDWDMLTGEILWTPQHEMLFGYAPGTPRRSFADFQNRLHPDDVERVEAQVRECIGQRTDFQCEFRVVWPDGGTHWLSGFGRFHYDAGGRPTRMLGMVEDISARKAVEEQVRQLNRDLEQRVAERVEELATKTGMLEEKAAELALSSQYKSEFLATMSHELRTPLNSILIFSQQLAANAPGNLTEKQVEFSRHIHSSGTDLLDLITDILDHSKIESGTVTVELGEIAFAELHGSIDRDFRHEAEARNLTFLMQFAEGLPAAMESDPKRLQQILRNLLSNAVKFTAHGKVKVRVDLAASGWRPDHPVLSQAPQVVAFAVEDTGIGIAPEKQQLIFEAFRQADAGTARKYGGTGLGLAISRELAALLGGEIRLASVLGEGSTFTLYLPLHYAGPDSPRPAPARLPPVARAAPVADVLQPDRSERQHLPDAALRGRKVLVVDDDARNIFALTAVFENEEMDVVSATNGRSAIEIIRQTPDLGLVLMDIMMPGMDGYETMRAIRQVPEHRTLPILALTAKAMPGDREKCLDAGASDYIAKPVNTYQLLALMRNWIAR